MKSENAGDFFNELSIYLGRFDNERSVKGQYVSLLTAVEIGILGFFFILIQMNETGYLLFFPMAGIVFCLLFGLSSDSHTKQVDIWQDAIAKLVKKSGLQNSFYQVKFGIWPKKIKLLKPLHGFAGHWFEHIVVTMFIIAWLYILWYYWQKLNINWIIFILCLLALPTYIIGLVIIHKEVKGGEFSLEE